MSDDRVPGFATLAVHAGAKPDPTTGARVTPIYQTASYVFNDADHAASLFGLQAFGNIYTRIMNPTSDVLEQRIAALEGGTAALAVASGHAAQVVTLHALMQPGDEFVAARQLYGGSINQFNHSFKSFGWTVKWADIDDIATFEKAIGPKTKAIFIESIANPGGAVTDIAAVAAIAKRAGVPLIVDNTLATPYLCRPFEHGADIVVHSLTKFIGGHGNSIGGIIVDGGKFNWTASDRYPMLSAPRPEYNGMVLGETFGNFAFAIACRVLGLRDLGPAISPFNSFLILTGAETLPLRMQRHSDNAARRGGVPRRPRQGVVGELCRAARRPLPPAGAEILPEGRRRVDDLRRRGRRRGRRQRGVEGEAVLAPCQYRRHAQPDHPSLVDHPQPVDRGAAQGGRRRAGRDPPFGRHRGRRRHHRRPRPGAGLTPMLA